MKFIVDAQLPRRLALELSGLGHEAVHTLDFPNGNRTSDGDIIAVVEKCLKTFDTVGIST